MLAGHAQRCWVFVGSFVVLGHNNLGDDQRPKTGSGFRVQGFGFRVYGPKDYMDHICSPQGATSSAALSWFAATASTGSAGGRQQQNLSRILCSLCAASPQTSGYRVLGLLHAA